MHFVGISIIQPKLGCCIVYIWQECLFIYAASRLTINASSKLVFQLLSIFGPHYEHRSVVAADYISNNCGFEWVLCSLYRNCLPASCDSVKNQISRNK